MRLERLNWWRKCVANRSRGERTGTEFDFRSSLSDLLLPCMAERKEREK